jgi:flagellar biosynthesis/type III secretory pathway protein FliH
MTAARIVKAQAVRDLSVRSAFNFVDLRQEADSVISQAQQSAATLLDEARREADSLFEETLQRAREQGLAQAETEIDRKAADIASQRLTDQLQTALPALKSAAEALQAERDRWLIRWEQTAIRVGVAVAEKLIKSQLSIRPELASAMIVDALRLAAGQPKLTIHLHPDDLAAWGDQGPRIVESLTACADSTLIADPQIGRGGCHIETIHGEIDARVETMLERLASELLDE